MRALQEKSFERLGGTKTIDINVRLVGATNRNLTEVSLIVITILNRAG